MCIIMREAHVRTRLSLDCFSIERWDAMGLWGVQAGSGIVTTFVRVYNSACVCAYVRACVCLCVLCVYAGTGLFCEQ